MQLEEFTLFNRTKTGFILLVVGSFSQESPSQIRDLTQRTYRGPGGYEESSD